MITTSATLHHLLPLLSEPFYFLEMGLRQHEIEDEAPQNWDGENHDKMEEPDFASLITNHMNLAKTIPLKEAVHDKIMPIQMEKNLIQCTAQQNKPGTETYLLVSLQ